MTHRAEQGDGVNSDVTQSFSAGIQFDKVMGSQDVKDLVDRFKQDSSIPAAFEGDSDFSISFDDEHTSRPPAETNDEDQDGDDDNRPRSSTEGNRLPHEDASEGAKPSDPPTPGRPNSQPGENGSGPKRVEDTVPKPQGELAPAPRPVSPESEVEQAPMPRAKESEIDKLLVEAAASLFYNPNLFKPKVNNPAPKTSETVPQPQENAPLPTMITPKPLEQAPLPKPVGPKPVVEEAPAPHEKKTKETLRASIGNSGLFFNNAK